MRCKSSQDECEDPKRKSSQDKCEDPKRTSSQDKCEVPKHSVSWESLSSSYGTNNDTITITSKGNDRITIPKTKNEHIIITCSQNDGIKVQCKQKRSRGGKRVQRSKRNKATAKKVKQPVKNVIAKCDICKRTMPSKPLMKYAKKKNASQFNVINLQNMKICPDCLTTNVQQRRETIINTALMKIIESAINTVRFDWSNKIEDINLQSATNLHSFLPYTMKCSNTFLECTSNK